MTTTTSSERITTSSILKIVTDDELKELCLRNYHSFSQPPTEIEGSSTQSFRNEELRQIADLWISGVK